ncbi:MAG: NfeD family protein [Saprospiraceae bacterium]|nr:NfeD family protein [Saprospiraceae bacterium]
MLLIITDRWNELSSFEQIFWGIALVFSLLFLIQFGLSLLGGDVDADADVDIDMSAGEHGSFSLDPSFTLLSVRSIIAFFTFFGWMGVLAISKGYSTNMVVLIAAGSGLAAMITVAYLMYFFSRLAEEGNADLSELIYKNATVYLTIPERRKGKGKVHVTLNSSLREMDAVTEGERLENGKSVKIVEIIEDNILVVEPVEIFDVHTS